MIQTPAASPDPAKLNENISLGDAIKIIDTKNKDILHEFDVNGKKYQIRNGKYGPYVSFNVGKKLKFVSVPKNLNIDNITQRDMLEIIDKGKK